MMILRNFGTNQSLGIYLIVHLLDNIYTIIHANI